MYYKLWQYCLLLLVTCLNICFACMCAPKHPQMHFCAADFAIVARVQKVIIPNDDQLNVVYKVRVRNVFKASPKAAVVLKNGRLVSPAHDSLCGLKLSPRETYLLTGKIDKLEALVRLCDFNQVWREVTPRQRKGFRMLYQNGCVCKIQSTFGHPAHRRLHRVSQNTCLAGFNDCFERHGVCLPTKTGMCKWARAPKLSQCIQVNKYNGTMT